MDKDDFLRYLDGLDDLDYFFSNPLKYGDDVREHEIFRAIRYGLKSNDKQTYDIVVGLNYKSGNIIYYIPSYREIKKNEEELKSE